MQACLAAHDQLIGGCGSSPAAAPVTAAQPASGSIPPLGRSQNCQPKNDINLHNYKPK